MKVEHKLIFKCLKMFLGAQQYNENKSVDITWCVQIYGDNWSHRNYEINH